MNTVSSMCENSRQAWDKAKNLSPGDYFWGTAKYEEAEEELTVRIIQAEQFMEENPDSVIVLGPLVDANRQMLESKFGRCV